MEEIAVALTSGMIDREIKYTLAVVLHRPESEKRRNENAFRIAGGIALE